MALSQQLLGEFVLSVLLRLCSSSVPGSQMSNVFIRGHSKNPIRLKIMVAFSHFRLLSPRDQQTKKRVFTLAGVTDFYHQE